MGNYAYYEQKCNVFGCDFGSNPESEAKSKVAEDFCLDKADIVINEVTIN